MPPLIAVALRLDVSDTLFSLTSEEALIIIFFLYGLIEREREILTYIAEDATNKAIANTLNSSVYTVERHREHIMHNLNLHTRTELVKYAIRKGLVSLDAG